MTLLQLAGAQNKVRPARTTGAPNRTKSRLLLEPFPTCSPPNLEKMAPKSLPSLRLPIALRNEPDQESGSWSPQSGTKSSFLTPLVCTAGRQTPVSLGSHPEARKRGCGPTLRARDQAERGHGPIMVLEMARIKAKRRILPLNSAISNQ